MFQDVRFACMVIWWCAEKYRENVVKVGAVHVNPLGSRRDMLQLHSVDVKEVNTLDRHNFKAIVHLAHL